MCGENTIERARTGHRRGSPPRVRGKPQQNASRLRRAGITPACAGKTAQTPPRRDRPQDHPRVCGENTVSPILSAVARGSPPRVRGKHYYLPGEMLVPGITPACAGKTHTCFMSQPCPEDHPRVCGENSTGSTSSRPKSGSPPRVRGKQRICVDYVDPSRITPACAGKT